LREIPNVPRNISPPSPEQKSELSNTPAEAVFLLDLFFDPGRLILYITPKCRAFSELHCVTAQKTALFIAIAVGTLIQTVHSFILAPHTVSMNFKQSVTLQTNENSRI
jgi:hypothetical protein